MNAARLWRKILRHGIDKPNCYGLADILELETRARDFHTCALGSQARPETIEMVWNRYEGFLSSEEAGQDVDDIALLAEEFPELVAHARFPEALECFDEIGRLVALVEAKETTPT